MSQNKKILNRIKENKALENELLQKSENPDLALDEASKEFESKPEEYTRPSNDTISKWYSHIHHLIVDIYVINSRIRGSECGFCEKWRTNQNEQNWLNRLHILLGLEESQVEVHVKDCDWDCIDASTYIDKNTGEEKTYPLQFDSPGKTYISATGWGITHFPGIVLWIKSDKIIGSDGRSHTSEKDKFENVVFQGIGEKVKRKLIYKIAGNIYKEEVEVEEVSIIHTLLQYLKNLDESIVSHHSKYSILLGQHYKITRVR